MSSSGIFVLRIVIYSFYIAGNLDGVHLTLTAFSKQLSASKIYRDVPVSLRFDVSFNNQGTYSINQRTFNTCFICLHKFYGTFTLHDTATDTERGYRHKLVQTPMGICVGVFLSLCGLNTSTQFFSTHFCWSLCRAV